MLVLLDEEDEVEETDGDDDDEEDEADGASRAAGCGMESERGFFGADGCDGEPLGAPDWALVLGFGIGDGGERFFARLGALAKPAPPRTAASARARSGCTKMRGARGFVERTEDEVGGLEGR